VLVVCAACRARFLAWALFAMSLNPRVLKLICVLFSLADLE
jgi:hypothetical protein